MHFLYSCHVTFSFFGRLQSEFVPLNHILFVFTCFPLMFTGVLMIFTCVQLVFTRFLLAFTCVLFIFNRVLLVLTRVLLESNWVLLVLIRVLLVVTPVQLCSVMYYLLSIEFICVLSWSIHVLLLYNLLLDSPSF